ncbi:hypothetical protein ACFE04_011996 [Oxalis oulophora]
MKVVEEKVADVVHLLIFNDWFMGIAEQMGLTLQRTSISTNIKERLDSLVLCLALTEDWLQTRHMRLHLPDTTVITPVFDNGKLVFFVASRRHHVEISGIFQEEVIIKLLTESIHNVPGTRKLQDNLSDHHVEIGGITPGSMPPFSKLIFEEGAAIKNHSSLFKKESSKKK